MYNRFFDNGKLKDGEIITALSDAADTYDNGEIIEVRDLLAEIVYAIDEFCDYCEG